MSTYAPETFDALVRFAALLQDVADWCFDHARQWKDVFLIGEVISPALGDVGDFLLSMIYHIYTLAYGLEHAWDFIHDFLEGSLLSDQIELLWDGWHDLIEHPGWFIIDQIFKYSPDFYWFVQEPVYWVEFWFTEKWPWLAAIIASPKDWVFDKLVEFWPDFYWVYQDPGYMLEFWLTERYPDLVEFLASPEDWLKARVGDPLEGVRTWMLGHLLEVVQEVIEKSWEKGGSE